MITEHTISVVVPTYNRPDLLRAALSSVCAQTYDDLEIIVIDDGDKISAESVVDAFNDSRICYVKNSPPRRGGGASRNIGIQHAKAKFIAFLDDDDRWVPDKLAIQMEHFANTSDKVGFCFSAIRTENENGSTESSVADGIYDFHELALTQFKGFITSTLIVKKKVFDEVGTFDEQFPSHQEIELILRITQRFQGLGVDKQLVIMNLFEHEHIGGDINKRIAGRELLLSKHTELYTQFPEKLAQLYFTLALWYREKGDHRASAKRFRRAFALEPRLRYLFHWWIALARSFGTIGG